MAVATYRVAEAAAPARSWNLALGFQEVFTAVVRLRYGKQAVPNAEAFRAHLKDALRAADQDGRARGYSAEDVQKAILALVAFIDESVLNSRNPVFADWSRRPLQEELYGRHIAGELFFETLQQLLTRLDSIETADLLEVYYLCLALGYRGRYVGAPGELAAIMQAVKEKMRRCRPSSPALSPRWQLPDEAIRTATNDAWVGRLVWVAAGCLAFAVLLFVIFKFALISGAGDLGAIAAQSRG
ncbi:MAG TPA: DotU family type IV/VI secretion system protein [Terriglobales bacterium]|nr:DotU family type IV/VI secretion system protein [Terriglobales bacterium]